MRLLWAVALFGLPMAAGYRFARKLQPPTGAVSDALLLGYLIQYISVGVLGLLGFLSPVWLTVVAVLLCAGPWMVGSFVSLAGMDLATPRPDRRWVLGICLGAIGFMGALVWSQRLQPPLATDALTYHLPAAVLWLQQKRIVLFQTWFFNPANTYSPLAGSMFATWLMAPLGNDALARFAQVGPWVLVFFTVLNLGRNNRAAALAALAVALSRPFVSEAMLAKDDLFAAAFFLCAVSALSPDRMKGRFGAFRLGAAVGLMLATKYTAMMALPILVLAVDSPFRAGWHIRQWGVSIGTAAMIAGPWYLRNLILFGNPVFPAKIELIAFHLPGLLPSIHPRALTTAKGLWQVITGTYYGPPPVVFIFLIVIWLIAVLRFRRAILNDPMKRVMILGPPLGIAIFAFFSPQAEVRFLLPMFALMFALCPMVAGGRWSLGVCSLAAGLAIATSFSIDNAGQIGGFVGWGIALALIGLVVRWIEADWLRLRWPVVSGVAGVGVILIVCVRWAGYLLEYRDARMGIWEQVYPAQAPMWRFIDENLSATETVAYSNEFMIYPLYGFDLRRRVIYAPVRRDGSVSSLVFPAGISDSDLFSQAGRSANLPADFSTWRENLAASGAKYLVVGRGTGAPELAWTDADSSHFVRVFDSAEAAVYRIVDLH